MDKIFHIEAQTLETYTENMLLNSLLKVAKEANYTIVHDHWGNNAYDTYTIDEAIEKFKPKSHEDTSGEDELPF